MGSNKQRLSTAILNLGATICLIAATALLIWSFLSKSRILQDEYAATIVWLTDFQNRITAIDNKWLILMIIELLFALKVFIPLPISVLFVISGMVFPLSYAIVIDLCGMVIMFTLKFYMGAKLGGGRIKKLLERYDFMKKAFESDSIHIKGLLLFIFRLVPVLPINLTSQMYGAMHYSFIHYLLVSVAGFLPRLFSYAIAGRNIFDPFSFAFTLPLMILFGVTGILLMTVNSIINAIQSKERKQTK